MFDYVSMTVPYYYIHGKQLRSNITAEAILPKETVARVARHKVLNMLKSRPELRWDSDKNVWVALMFKSWNSHHSHYNKHLRTTCHAFVFLNSFYLHHDKFYLSFSLSLHTWFLMWLLGLVWTAEAEALVCSRLVLLEKRELWHHSRELPLTFSPTLFLYTTTFSTVAYQTSKMLEVLLMSFSFASLVCLFLDFWEHWFLHVQIQHTELIKLTCVHAQTQFRCDG